MAAAGVPQSHPSPVPAACHAALDMLAAANAIKQELENFGPAWDIRIGIHAGPVLAGIIGKTKFAYDIWGHTVNLASRMESASLPGRINATATVHRLAGPNFLWEERGFRSVKNLDEVEMFFLLGKAQPA